MGARIEKDRRGNRGAIMRTNYEPFNNIEMTKSEFLQAAAIAFIRNPKVLADNITVEQCVNNIVDLAERLTQKVEEKTSFDLEFAPV